MGNSQSNDSISADHEQSSTIKSESAEYKKKTNENFVHTKLYDIFNIYNPNIMPIVLEDDLNIQEFIIKRKNKYPSTLSFSRSPKCKTNIPKRLKWLKTLNKLKILRTLSNDMRYIASCLNNIKNLISIECQARKSENFPFIGMKKFSRLYSLQISLEDSLFSKFIPLITKNSRTLSRLEITLTDDETSHNISKELFAKKLSSLKQIKSLSFRNFLRTYDYLIVLERLQDLTINFSSLDSENRNDITKAFERIGNSKLKSLSLINCHTYMNSDQDFQNYFEKLSNLELEIFKFSYSDKFNLKMGGQDYLFQTISSTKIKTLDLVFSDFGLIGQNYAISFVSKLKNLLTLQNLIIRLSGNVWQPISITLGGCLSILQNLKKIDLDVLQYLNDTHIEKLSLGLSSLKNLEELTIHIREEKFMTKKGQHSFYKSISALLKLKKLDVYLFGFEIENNDFRELLKALEGLQEIESLDLAIFYKTKNKNEKDLKSFSEIITKFKNMKRLHLSLLNQTFDAPSIASLSKSMTLCKILSDVKFFFDKESGLSKYWRPFKNTFLLKENEVIQASIRYVYS